MVEAEISAIFEFWLEQHNAGEEVFRFHQYLDSKKEIQQAIYPQPDSSDEEDAVTALERFHKRNLAGKSSLRKTSTRSRKRKDQDEDEDENEDEDEEPQTSEDEDGRQELPSDADSEPAPPRKKTRKSSGIKQSAKSKGKRRAVERPENTEGSQESSDDDEPQPAPPTKSSRERPAPAPVPASAPAPAPALAKSSANAHAKRKAVAAVKRVDRSQESSADEEPQPAQPTKSVRKPPAPAAIRQSEKTKGKRTAVDTIRHNKEAPHQSSKGKEKRVKKDTYEIPGMSSSEELEDFTTDASGFGPRNVTPAYPTGPASANGNFRKQTHWLASLCDHEIYQRLVSYRSRLSVRTVSHDSPHMDLPLAHSSILTKRYPGSLTSQA